MASKRTVEGENAAIDLYCRLNKTIVIQRPKQQHEQPDAIIQHNQGHFDWIEITTAWIGNDIELQKRQLSGGQNTQNHAAFAKALNSQNSHEEIFYHRSSMSYLESMKIAVLHSILEKDKNMSYQPILEKYGKGILIVNLEDPYYELNDLMHIELAPEFNRELFFFRSIFLYVNSSHVLIKGSVSSNPSKLIALKIDQSNMPRAANSR